MKTAYLALRVSIEITPYEAWAIAWRQTLAQHRSKTQTHRHTLADKIFLSSSFKIECEGTQHANKSSCDISMTHQHHRKKGMMLNLPLSSRKSNKAIPSMIVAPKTTRRHHEMTIGCRIWENSLLSEHAFKSNSKNKLEWESTKPAHPQIDISCIQLITQHIQEVCIIIKKPKRHQVVDKCTEDSQLGKHGSHISSNLPKPNIYCCVYSYTAF